MQYRNASVHTWATCTFQQEPLFKHLSAGTIDSSEYSYERVWRVTKPRTQRRRFDKVNRSRRQSRSATDRLNFFSGRVGRLKPVNATLPSLLLVHLLILIWPTFPKPHAKKVWILDCLLILPFSGLRLRILLVSSICVFPKETELHVLLKQGRRGWLHPNYHLEGCYCHRHALPCGSHHPRCDRNCF